MKSKKKVEKSIQLINTIHETLYTKKLLESQRPVLVALSGGQDSMCLLFILVHLRNLWKLKVTGVWWNHFWQLESLNTMALLWKIHYYSHDPFLFGIRIHVPNSEEKARNWREKMFRRSLVFSNAQTVMTAHTASDSIETSLFNLFRGTSSQGINSLLESKTVYPTQVEFDSISQDWFDYPFSVSYCRYSLKQIPESECGSRWRSTTAGSSVIQSPQLSSQTLFQPDFFHFFQATCYLPVQKIDFESASPIKFFSSQKTSYHTLKLVRPLLGFTRYDSKQLLKFFDLPVYPDQTNRLLNYTRNRIRKQFLPLLRVFFNSQIDQSLMQFNQTVLDEQTYFNSIFSRLNLCHSVSTSNTITLDISILYFLPGVLQKRVIRNVLKGGFGISPHLYHINFISNFLNNINFENHIIQNSPFFHEPKPHYLFFPQVGCIVLTKNKFILYR